MASVRIQHRIDASLKKEVETILKEQGIKPSVAVTLFYTEIKRSGGFPFTPSRVPNKKLKEDIKSAEKGEGSKTYKNAKQLLNHLNKL